MSRRSTLFRALAALFALSVVGALGSTLAIFIDGRINRRTAYTLLDCR